MTGPADRDALLVAYVDGELDAGAVAEVEQLIAGDARLRADVEMFRSTSALLRAACGEQHYERAPGAAAPAVRTPARIRRRHAAAALAAGVVLAFCGFGAGTWWGASGSSLLDEIAEYHGVISKETAHLAELPPERADEFVGWMGRRLGRRLAVPDLRPVGLTFAGGRMLVIGGQPVADFLYTRSDGPPVALCVARGESGPAALHVVEQGALRLAAWTDAGATYVVVGDLDAAAARRIAGLAASQIES